MLAKLIPVLNPQGERSELKAFYQKKSTQAPQAFETFLNPNFLHLVTTLITIKLT
jgi:hypothetical protein